MPPVFLLAALGAGILYFALSSSDNSSGSSSAQQQALGPRPPKTWFVIYGDDLALPMEPGSYYITRLQPKYLSGDYDAKVHVSKKAEIVHVVEDKGKLGVRMGDKAILVYWDKAKNAWVESATSRPAYS